MRTFEEEKWILVEFGVSVFRTRGFSRFIFYPVLYIIIISIGWIFTNTHGSTDLIF